MENLAIKPLHACPQEFCSVLAGWSYYEWNEKRKVPYKAILNEYQGRRKSTSLPVTLAALYQNEPVGMVTMKDNDLRSRGELIPWLSSLYVIPEMRKKGVGGSLVSELISLARYMAYVKLYLFLAHESYGLENFYVSRGWQFLSEAVDNDGYDTKIYYYSITS